MRSREDEELITSLRREIEILESEVAGAEDFIARTPSLYKCAWPNGDVSVVYATNEEDAIEWLDEVGGAEPEMLTELAAGTFMLHFTPTHDEEAEWEEGDGEKYYTWVLENFGGCTVDDGGALSDEEAKKGVEEQEKRTRDAVIREKRESMT